MSYSISISGHKDGLSPEEAQEFEQAQADVAKKLVAELDGVLNASFSGGNIGAVNLAKSE